MKKTRGQRLRDLRQSLWLTQADIAAELVCSQTAISKIERNSHSSGLIDRYEELLRNEAKRGVVTGC